MGTAADPGVLPRALDVVFNSIGKGRMMGGIALKPKHFSEVRTLSSNDQTKEKDAKDKLMAQVRVCACVCVWVYVLCMYVLVCACVYLCVLVYMWLALCLCACLCVNIRHAQACLICCLL